MTHLGFVATAYALGILVPVVFAVTSATRLATARRRLAAVNPRALR